MDALAFLRERKRMCNSYKCCVGCPLVESHCIVSSATSDEDFKKMTDVVEQWSKEHPRKTRQSKFLEMFPNTSVIANGTLGICPKSLDKNRNCFYSIGQDNSKIVDCLGCRNQFWLEEVE